jgi:hypothetical protein
MLWLALMTNPMTPELKACPFCGDKAFEVLLPRKNEILCRRCCVSMVDEPFDGARASVKWNARTAAEPEWRPFSGLIKDDRLVLVTDCLDPESVWMVRAKNALKGEYYKEIGILPPPPRKES